MKNHRPIGFGEGDQEALEEWVESKPKTWVFAGDEGWIDLSGAEFLDIAEDMFGRDKITFEYSGQTHESIAVYTENKP